MRFGRQREKGTPTDTIFSWTAGISRIIISAPFLYAGYTKITDPENFAVVIDGYGLLPESLVFPMAVIIPTLEIIAALGLLIGKRICLHITTSLLILFIAVLGYGIHLGLDVDCGCFSQNDPEQAYHDLKGALFRDIGLLVPTFYLFWFHWRMDPGKAAPSL